MDGRSGKQAAPAETSKPGPASHNRSPQWATLTARCLAVKLQDRAYTGLLLGQSVFVALLVVFVCGSYEKSMAVFGLIMAALFGPPERIEEIVGEWAIYRRERMVNLALGPHIASKFTVLGCFAWCSAPLWQAKLVRAAS